MPIVVNLREAKARLSQLPEQAHAGQEVILTQQGRPVARLIALHATAMARQPGGLAGHVAADVLDPLPEAELAAWSPS